MGWFQNPTQLFRELSLRFLTKERADELYADRATAGTGDMTGPSSAIVGNLPTFSATSGKVVTDSAVPLASLATLASPAFTGTPTVPTQTAGNNTTRAASTAFVLSEVALEVTARNTAITAALVGMWDDRGNYNASVNTFPAAGGSGFAGAILKGDVWLVTVAGTLGGVSTPIGALVRALIDTPAQTAGTWAITDANTINAAITAALLLKQNRLLNPRTLVDTDSVNIAAADDVVYGSTGTSTYTENVNAPAGTTIYFKCGASATQLTFAAGATVDGASTLILATSTSARLFSLGSGVWIII